MFSSLIVGFGRSGRELHLPVLMRARAAQASAGLFRADPVVACDPFCLDCAAPEGAVLVRSVAHAARLVDPAATVVHVCTPPSARLETLEELATTGFRRLIVEKPLALDQRTVAGIIAARKRWRLDVNVVAPWLASALTDRVRELVASRELGRLRSIEIVQRKPRFRRSIVAQNHPSAFDIEVPHALAVALALAGSARVVNAGATDMVVDDLVMPRMGGAWLDLEHQSGVRTEIRSDLTSMVRERRITLRCDKGTIVGHYPCSAADDAAQLCTTVGSQESRTVFRNDDLTSFIVRAYERFGSPVAMDLDLVLQAELVRLLEDARRISEQPAAPVSLAAAQVVRQSGL